MIAANRSTTGGGPNAQLRLPALVLTRYLFFLTRRPISVSNRHYLARRISGLRSLANLIEQDDARLQIASAHLLRTLTPQNFHMVAEQLDLRMLPSARVELPREYVVGNRPPPPSFWSGVESILLLLGPAIGIGDEIIAFPLPAWIKERYPQARIQVLSAYDGLWDRVAAVESHGTYSDYAALVHALRGELGQHDLVILVDFECPGLEQVLCLEGNQARYLELSIGAQTLAAVDRTQRWIYRYSLPAACFGNYYAGFDYLVRGLGLTPSVRQRFGGIVRCDEKRQQAALRVFVSPFTSKYDPSPVYWSRLLAGVVPPAAERPVALAIDPGPNADTRRFASTLARSATALAAGPATFHLAGGNERGVSLARALDEMEQADVVICADSFAAHAAPVLGCTTLVIASPGLENWRVPSKRSFYFSAEAPLERVVAGFQQVLSHFGLERPQACRRPTLTAAERHLRTVIDEMGRLWELDGRVGFEAWQALYAQMVEAIAGIQSRLPFWPEQTRGLIGDFGGDWPARPMEEIGDLPAEFRTDVLHYWQSQFQELHNSNLYKYLALMMDEHDHDRDDAAIPGTKPVADH